ncbi:MAG TPA: nucleotidyltransferase [Friedmanniella sp.]
MTTGTLTSRTGVDQILADALERIQVKRSEIDEAKRRRELIAAALQSEFRGSRTYANGSVAHGDALTPLLDVDLGVVVPDPEHKYGPNGLDSFGLRERAASAMRDALKAEFGELRVEVRGHKRSVLVRFNDAVRPGWEDFTADIIVAVDYPYGAGLYIPRHSSWDRSDPEAHTRMVVAAIRHTEISYARVVRLVKHWARQDDDPVLCSWHIKALALGSIIEPVDLLGGLIAWFEHAADELDRRDTPDPAGVGPDIKVPGGDRRAVAARLHAATRQLHHVAADAGWLALAHEQLANFFDDEQMLPRPDRVKVIQEQTRRLSAECAHGSARATVAAAPAVRSWRP